MRAVFLDQQTFKDEVSFAAISAQLSQITHYRLTSPKDIVQRCQQADIVITNKVVLTKKILSQLPELKLICIAATGTNNVDIDAARALNIAVTNVSRYARHSVSQYVFAQILEYYNQTSHHLKNTRQGLWQHSETFCYHGNKITELAGKAIGIIGYGHLGQAVAHIAKAFDMQVLIAERPNAESVRGDRLPFNEVIEQADILTLHCPQTPETEQLIDQKVLQAMKPSAMLINTARGAIIDDNALIAALEQHQIAYAVLDVLDQEPPSDSHPLIQCDLPNLKLTAHIAWASIEAQQRLIDMIGDNIAAFNGGIMLNRVD